jgi:hypothetical protein
MTRASRSKDTRELEDIMDETNDATPERKKSLLQRAEAWVVKHKGLFGAGGAAEELPPSLARAGNRRRGNTSRTIDDPAPTATAARSHRLG